MIRVLLTVIFVLAVAGPETHACPIHSSLPGAPVSHHQDQNSHQKAGHCTCPQACCPTAVRTALAVHATSWLASVPAVQFVDPGSSTSVLLAARKHLLPLALAPPLALA
jgi:hypothetical protein